MIKLDVSTSAMGYTRRYLQAILDNLEVIQGLGDTDEFDLGVGVYGEYLDGTLHVDYGLCDNVLLAVFDFKVASDIFECWSDGSGIEHDPVGGTNFAIDQNLYQVPRRIELIQHIISVLDFNLNVDSEVASDE